MKYDFVEASTKPEQSLLQMCRVQTQDIGQHRQIIFLEHFRMHADDIIQGTGKENKSHLPELTQTKRLYTIWERPSKPAACAPLA